MNERKLKAYFKTQLHAIMRRSASEPDGFRAYFADREPKDEEILGLLAVNAMVNGEFPHREFFPTPVEALAALSPAARSLICREFRKELKGRLRHLPQPKPRPTFAA
jgi:hypothetical protein